MSEARKPYLVVSKTTREIKWQSNNLVAACNRADRDDKTELVFNYGGDKFSKPVFVGMDGEFAVYRGGAVL